MNHRCTNRCHRFCVDGTRFCRICTNVEMLYDLKKSSLRMNPHIEKFDPKYRQTLLNSVNIRLHEMRLSYEELELIGKKLGEYRQ